jgi:acetylornithine deacetylase/succinyl-diaminopimelate desuccinylase-like protein
MVSMAASPPRLMAAGSCAPNDATYSTGMDRQTRSASGPPVAGATQEDKTMSVSASVTRAYVQAHQQQFLEELKGLLRIPSISTLPEHKADIARAAEYVAAQLRGIELDPVEVIATQGHPLVYGEWLRAEGKPTVLIYGHYDVQPVDPVELWESPPFEPTLRGDNLYCRGACDDKGQVFALIKALETLMRTGAGRLPVNIKVLIEGEEEAGGEAIEQYVKEHPDRLRADVALVADTGMVAPGIPCLTYGLRGILYTEVEARGATHDLHSGTYGGIAPNPLHALAIIIAGLKDSQGHITIPGFYDKVRPVTGAERELWRRIPRDPQELLQEIGSTDFFGEEEYDLRERMWARPTLEVHGIAGGFTAEGAKTVIPAIAKAKISMRLVPDQTAEEIMPLFGQRVHDLCPKGTQVEVRSIHSGAWVLMSPDSPEIAAAAAALAEEFGREPVFIREGGSVPVVALFDSVLHVPTVLMGFGLPDDNLHAPNEKFYLPNFYSAVRCAAGFLQRLGA